VSTVSKTCLLFFKKKKKVLKATETYFALYVICNQIDPNKNLAINADL